ncbi:DUF7689 domain-containing protein [Epilithonimonas xixisoli]|uniref:DUF7689 domain-containing protein n=1 Tax=Epilithonimonas xixisoli TaxID=1476462 RepID=A0A4R8IFC6_9FLAO|nr:hypothetical protein [Epilithonimonas xixisoli]TDX84410.1 hypothetical protein B0I22_2029 [Epilithonimonas xixisoli]
MKNQLSIPEHFPNTKIEPLIITSPITNDYNCIAWAFGCSNLWFWPDSEGLYFWPKEIPRECTKEAFIKLYELIGYEVCFDESFEEGKEKVVIYLNSNEEPTHAAKQIDNNFWSSKLGPHNDVSHSLFALEDGVYGNARIFMKRDRKS